MSSAELMFPIQCIVLQKGLQCNAVLQEQIELQPDFLGKENCAAMKH